MRNLAPTAKCGRLFRRILRQPSRSPAAERDWRAEIADSLCARRVALGLASLMCPVTLPTGRVSLKDRSPLSGSRLRRTRSLSMSRSQRERRLVALPRALEVLDFEVLRFA